MIRWKTQCQLRLGFLDDGYCLAESTPCTPHNVNYYTREMMNEGDSLPFGIILCADKSDSAVKYTLPEDNNQIFASKRRSKSTASRWRDNKPRLTFYTQTFEIKKTFRQGSTSFKWHLFCILKARGECGTDV